MNSDIRISITCPDHPKSKKLMRRLGGKAFWNLIKFWCFVATNKPSGDITGYDKDDIEIGAGWDGAEGEFYSALIDLVLIEKRKNSLFVHDWEEHNSWAFGADSRSKKAKLAAKARWKNKKQSNATSNATSINEHCNADDPGNALIPSLPTLTYPNGLTDPSKGINNIILDRTIEGDSVIDPETGEVICQNQN